VISTAVLIAALRLASTSETAIGSIAALLLYLCWLAFLVITGYRLHRRLVAATVARRKAILDTLGAAVCPAPVVYVIYALVSLSAECALPPGC
jgi:hypothetical protein